MIFILAFVLLTPAAFGQDPLPFFTVPSPKGLTQGIRRPEGNGYSPARTELGRRLFFDPILSADRSVSCASCHDPRHGWSDPRPLSRGIGGKTTVHHAPSLLNRAFGRRFMWDGRAESLEEQVLLPIENPLEMGLPVDEAVARLAALPDYAEAFRMAYGSSPDRRRLAFALAQFVRRLRIGKSPVDRFRRGEARHGLSTEEKVGLWIFESRGRCWRCHGGDNFTDETFHNTGVGVRGGRPAPGRFAWTKAPEDLGRFKTPTLRGLTFTAPYMHDGSLETLEDVVDFYRRGGGPNPKLDPFVAPIAMTDREARALVAFLKALSRP